MSRLIVASVLDSLQAFNRVVSLLRGRSFAIDGISVARSDPESLVLLTLVVSDRERRPQHVALCLEKLEEVMVVRQPSTNDSVVREGALVKVSDSVAAEGIPALEGVARVVDRVSGATILEMFGDPDTVQRAVEAIPSEAVIECVRFGPFVMHRGGAV